MKVAAQRGLHAERAEHVGGDAIAYDLLRIINARQIESAPVEGGQVLEDARLPLPVVEIGGRGFVMSLQIIVQQKRISLPDDDETLKLSVRQRAQQHSI